MLDFVNLKTHISVGMVTYQEVDHDHVRALIEISHNGETKVVSTQGNGRLDCISNALKQITNIDFTLESYVQHAIEEKSTSKAASYVAIVEDNKTYWGTGIHTDIMTSSIYAIVTAVNRMLDDKGDK